LITVVPSKRKAKRVALSECALCSTVIYRWIGKAKRKTFKGRAI
jgi:hypothetical protein